MIRNLDMTALRAFVTVADVGGVTRAAGHLHLTQSAVSMQLKRLEEALGERLFDRSGRALQLTPQGELLLSYGRRLLKLNDEVWLRLTDQVYEGTLVFGVPHDIVHPHIPHVLREFAAAYPRVKVQLVSSFTRQLKEQFRRGEIDLTLTTEEGVDADAETLTELDLVWFGANGGIAWQQRPLRLAYEGECVFREITQRALDDVGVPWEMAVESGHSMTVEATVIADLAVHARLRSTAPANLKEIDHRGTLPTLPSSKVNMLVADAGISPLAQPLAAMVREAYARAPEQGAEYRRPQPSVVRLKPNHFRSNAAPPTGSL